VVPICNLYLIASLGRSSWTTLGVYAPDNVNSYLLVIIIVVVVALIVVVVFNMVTVEYGWEAVVNYCVSR